MKKRKSNADRAAAPEMTAAEKAREWPWFVRQCGDQWEVFALGPLMAQGYKSEEVRVAVCDSRELARELVSNRQIAENATNWIGLIYKTLGKALTSSEAKGYRAAWQRAGIPFDEIDAFEKALEASPLEPPSPPEYA